MMKLLWVKSDLIGSRIIRWGLGNKSSHFVLSFDDDYEGNGLAFHSFGLGPKIDWFGDILCKYQVVYMLTPAWEMSDADEEKIYYSAIKKYRKNWYDYSALLYWSWRAFLKKYFSIKLPEKNIAQMDNSSLCTALARCLFDNWPDRFPELSSIDLEIMEPDRLYYLLAKNVNLAKNDDWIIKMNQMRCFLK